MLNPHNIANIMTLEQIDAKIALYQSALDDAMEVDQYDISDTQSRQKVASQDPEKVAKILDAYMQARAIKTEETGTKLYAGRFVR